MADMNRTIQELLVDYADALRDGSVPSFLKSLTREEGQLLTSSRQFWDAAEMVRTVNSAGFADKAVTPNVSLFFSRVNAEIASRLKQAKGPTQAKRTTDTRHTSQHERTEKQI
jgi:hypothetical protein